MNGSGHLRRRRYPSWRMNPQNMMDLRSFDFFTVYRGSNRLCWGLQTLTIPSLLRQKRTSSEKMTLCHCSTDHEKRRLHQSTLFCRCIVANWSVFAALRLRKLYFFKIFLTKYLPLVVRGEKLL